MMRAFSKSLLLLLASLWLLFASTGQSVQADPEKQSILLRKVMLIDPTGKTDDRLVNILIRDGRLDVITEDPIPGSEADRVIDAAEGYIFGQLVVGEPPNFMILSEDPRENFGVLLDTKIYARFAIHDGRVVRNSLGEVAPQAREVDAPKKGWLAYTPPPMAVPMNYHDQSKWNNFNSRWVSGLVTGAIALDRMNWLSQDAVNEALFGDLDEFNGGEIRALRIGVFGTLNFEKPWVYTIAGATNAFDKGFETEDLDNFTLFDWRLDIPFFRNSVMSIGKQKEPISMERLTGMVFLPWQERTAPADAFLPSRNVGIVWNGSSPETYSSWAFGVFNDWLDSGESFDEGSEQFVGRLTWAPLRSEDDSNLLHLGLGYRYSAANEGFRYQTEPEFNKSPVFVDTGFGSESGLWPADRLNTYNLELSWRRGPFWLASEYYRTDVKNAALENPTFDGYFVSASWILTGEMREYSKKNGLFRPIPIARTVYQNGKGAWEFAVRYSDIDLSDGRVDGGEMQIASLGLNWWLTPFFSLGMNYHYIWNELGGLEGNSSGLATRILIMLD